jgi:hypothetical protein
MMWLLMYAYGYNMLDEVVLSHTNQKPALNLNMRIKFT